MFQFRGFAHQIGVICLQHIGLPHSDIRGLTRVCQSPRLFAAYHVLHRFREPRHPPFALSYFLAHHSPFCKTVTASFSFLNNVNELFRLVVTDLPKRQYRVSRLYCHRIALSGPFVENKGVEPLTSCVQSRRSSQLS